MLRAKAFDLLLFCHHRHLFPQPLAQMIHRSASRQGHFSIAAVTASEIDARHPDESCVRIPRSRPSASRVVAQRTACGEWQIEERARSPSAAPRIFRLVFAALVARYPWWRLESADVKLGVL